MYKALALEPEDRYQDVTSLTEDLQAYLNAIEPFGGEMLRRKSRRLSQIQINSQKSPENPNLSDQGLRQHLIETEWEDELPLSA